MDTIPLPENASSPIVLTVEDKVTSVRLFISLKKPSGNNGAAFSLLAGNRVLLLLISLVMSAGFIFFYVKEFKKLNTMYRIALALMITGAVGNLIDRAFYWPNTTGFDGVIDWILFVFWGYEFAMFNIADSCLVIGIVLILIEMLIEGINEAKKKAKRGEYKYSPEELEKQKKDEANKGE